MLLLTILISVFSILVQGFNTKFPFMEHPLDSLRRKILSAEIRNIHFFCPAL
jgi:hypothetical protein